jgi:GNAT superfamily N-acetyltransferase
MLINERTLGILGLAAYVGSVDGEDVVTGLGFVVDDAVGVFSIATLEAHRRRGYGAAMTAHIVAEAAAAGARWAWLQSSELGLGVYAALGFITIESWPLWMTS